MGTSIFFWIGFHVFVFLMLALDLGVFHRRSHKVLVKEAVIWSCIWISLAMLFDLLIYFDKDFGPVRALEFLTGYLIEYSLSVDNIFVFILIFSYFAIKGKYQHKILFWGIIGALIMRGSFIIAGVALINRFQAIVIIFGGFLVFTGVRLLFHKDSADNPEQNPVVKFFRRFMPVTETLDEDKLFIIRNKKLHATPLFLVLLIIETSDVIFAVDSIPAVLAISKSVFIIYTSNILAILGLRSLYFAIAGIMGYFRFLKVGLAFVLTFVGMKMLASFFHFEISILLSLAIIASILMLSILASVIIKRKGE